MSAAATDIVESCTDCEEYFERRSPLVLLNGIVAAAELRGITNAEVADGFVHGLHQRHLAGLSIAVEAPTEGAVELARAAALEAVRERLVAS